MRKARKENRREDLFQRNPTCQRNSLIRKKNKIKKKKIIIIPFSRHHGDGLEGGDHHGSGSGVVSAAIPLVLLSFVGAELLRHTGRSAMISSKVRSILDVSQEGQGEDEER